MKLFVRKVLQSLFRRSIARLNENEKDGVRRLVWLLLEHRLLTVGLILFGFGAAIFEGGTIGILGFAVAILIGGQGLPIGEVSGPIGIYIDRFLESTSKEGIFLFLIGIAVVAQVIKSGLLYASQVSQIYLSVSLRRDMQKKVTEHIMALTYSQVSRNPAGMLGGIIDEAQFVQDFVDIVSNVSRAALMLTVYFLIFFTISLPLTAATAVVILLLWIALTRIVAVIKTLSKQVARAKILAWRWTVEYLNAPRLLRVFDSTQYAGELINATRDKLLFPERKSVAIEAAIKPAMEIIITVGAGVVLVTGYFLSGEGAVAAIPALFVFVLVFYRMKSQIQAFSDLRTKFARILPRLEMVEKFLKEHSKEASSSERIPFIGVSREIEFSAVNFCYETSETKAITNLTFTIPHGNTVALVGVSGSGKSTVADLLVRLYEPTSGKILVDGIDLTRLNVSDWREKIGVVDQEVFLLNTSVINNIKFARPDATVEAVIVAARTAHAHEFIERLEDGYETVIGDRGYGLSGGQQQRLALARALLRNPDILILDEATSALDTISERMIQKALEEMHNERTILVIAHRLSTIKNADLIVVLEEGRIVEQGTKEELLGRKENFFQLWNLQTDN